MIRVWLVRVAWVAGVVLTAPLLTLLAWLVSWVIALVMTVVHHTAYGVFGRIPWMSPRSGLDGTALAHWLVDPAASWWAWLLGSAFSCCLAVVWWLRRREQHVRSRPPSGLPAAIAVGAALVTVAGIFVCTLLRFDTRAEKARLIALVGQRVFGDERFPHRELSYRIKPAPENPYRMLLIWTFACDEAAMARARAAPRDLPFELHLTREGTVVVIAERE